MEDLNLLSIIVAVIGIAAGIWKTFDAKFWKQVAFDSFELVEEIKKSKDETSPGGKEITLEEKANIGEKAMDLAIPLWDKLAGKLKKK